MTVTRTSELNKSYTMPLDYIESVYAGWLGKVIGVRHGSNIEGWSYERIARTYGEITGYVNQFKHFAADDDTNGPLFFLKALEDYTHTTDITEEQMGLTWLNYAPDGHGFFWWGGYGKSTEHTAYLNLKHGIKAPLSGSIAVNGAAVAEQIGGQIFCDIWGLIAPGRPELAANYAGKMASVSHDGNGKYGAMFIAACIAAAFGEKDVSRIIETGLSVIPQESEYFRMTRDIMAYHSSNPDNWREAFAFVQGNYGYDRYPGACHIIPNSAVIVLSLLYGEGDFSRSINICNMCGWDTDCNVANVGTIIGVRVGLEGIDASWREPINDILICSGVIGTLNIRDLPDTVFEIARIGYTIADEAYPERWAPWLNRDHLRRGPRFHFELPGSTHGFKVECDEGSNVTAFVQHSNAISASGTSSLKVVFDNAFEGNGYRAYYKTYYIPSDFNDSRYDPSFSPLLYPGQWISAKVSLPADTTVQAIARLYVKDIYSKQRFYSPNVPLEAGKWTELQYGIPSMADVCLGEIGVEVIPVAENSNLGPMSHSLVYYVDHFDITAGGAAYSLQFQRVPMEKWTPLHQEVSQFTYLRGLWSVDEGKLVGSYYGEPAEIYTGDIEWSNYRFDAVLTPKRGDEHHLLFRVQGGIRSYAVGCAEGGKIKLYKNNNGYTELAAVDFPWVIDQSYQIGVEAIGNRFSIFANGDKILEFEDEESPYLTGQIGFANFQASRTEYESFHIKCTY
ncbi:ADP-ribosylglycohydrolase family protein [Paenibacillus sp. GCM10012306]|uniref:ADP-ribosylglycohydrolase family protein n=1 Tax=Paenibacillus sp. GCM10012306 TaxID=3317342 RepID=UPI00360F2064